jgi:uncharacterized membrane protein YecN with MAPEG domain
MCANLHLCCSKMTFIQGLSLAFYAVMERSKWQIYLREQGQALRKKVVALDGATLQVGNLIFAVFLKCPNVTLEPHCRWGIFLLLRRAFIVSHCHSGARYPYPVAKSC